MREFFYQCLEDLEMLTGIKQYFFLQRVDEDDFKRQLGILVDGMLKICGEFPRLTEERKRFIIRDMMVKDQSYESLNGRTIYKWLSLNNPIATEAYQEPPKVILTEEESKRIDELAERFKSQLKGIGGPIMTGVDDEIERIKKEDAARVSRPKSVSGGHRGLTPDEIYEWQLKNEWGKEVHDINTGQKLPDWIDFETWKRAKFEVQFKKP